MSSLEGRCRNRPTCRGNTHNLLIPLRSSGLVWSPRWAPEQLFRKGSKDKLTPHFLLGVSKFPWKEKSTEEWFPVQVRTSGSIQAVIKYVLLSFPSLPTRNGLYHLTSPLEQYSHEWPLAFSVSNSIYFIWSYHIKLLEIQLLSHSSRFNKASWFGTEGPRKPGPNPPSQLCFSPLLHRDFILPRDATLYPPNAILSFNSAYIPP